MPHRTLADQVHNGFPAAMRVTDFVDRLGEACAQLDLVATSSLLIVGVCRDELCYPFVARLEDVWGPAFHIGSLGGLVTIGRAGISAALGHAPEDPGAPRRYVVVAGPHIGMDEAGEFGHLRREHQAADTGTCGALMAFRDELVDGHVEVGYDPNDPEMSLLRQRLMSSLAYGSIPGPVELARLVARLIDHDIGDLIRWQSSRSRSHEVFVALVTGVLIHTGGGDWFEPGHSRFWSSRSGEIAWELDEPPPD